jgi:hypothetical protein
MHQIRSSSNGGDLLRKGGISVEVPPSTPNIHLQGQQNICKPTMPAISSIATNGSTKLEKNINLL